MDGVLIKSAPTRWDRNRATDARFAWDWSTPQNHFYLPSKLELYSASLEDEFPLENIEGSLTDTDERGRLLSASGYRVSLIFFTLLIVPLLGWVTT